MVLKSSNQYTTLNMVAQIPNTNPEVKPGAYESVIFSGKLLGTTGSILPIIHAQPLVLDFIDNF
jgi:hypothetical protein